MPLTRMMLYMATHDLLRRIRLPAGAHLGHVLRMDWLLLRGVRISSLRMREVRPLPLSLRWHLLHQGSTIVLLLLLCQVMLWLLLLLCLRRILLRMLMLVAILRILLLLMTLIRLRDRCRIALPVSTYRWAARPAPTAVGDVRVGGSSSVVTRLAVVQQVLAALRPEFAHAAARGARVLGNEDSGECRGPTCHGAGAI